MFTLHKEIKQNQDVAEKGGYSIIDLNPYKFFCSSPIDPASYD